MNLKLLRVAAIVVAIALTSLIVAACGGSEHNSDARDTASKAAEANREKFTPYIPKNEVEGKNYNKSQELYDNPNTILYCTILPTNPTLKAITIPIAGKLTSSSVSAFPSQEIHYDNEGGNTVTERASVDGLFHGSPPPYRYGFTPGGNFVEVWSGDEGICTTSPTEIQTQTLSVGFEGSVDAATAEAEKALEAGEPAKAEQIIAEGVKSR
jgi:hypothetical protein